jgi:hypothetical protein
MMPIRRVDDSVDIVALPSISRPSTSTAASSSLSGERGQDLATLIRTAQPEAERDNPESKRDNPRSKRDNPRSKRDDPEVGTAAVELERDSPSSVRISPKRQRRPRVGLSVR